MKHVLLNSVYYIRDVIYRMGIKERKEKDKSRVRHLILTAALELFSEVGYEKTTIRKIANRIEYSPSTIYLYFKDKDQIFFELQSLIFLDFESAILSVFDTKNPMKRITLCGEVYIEFAMKNKEWYDLIFISQAPMSNILKDDSWNGGSEMFEMIKLTVVEAMDQGLMKIGSVEARAISLWGHLHGIITLTLSGRYRMFDEEHIVEILQKSNKEFIQSLRI